MQSENYKEILEKKPEFEEIITKILEFIPYDKKDVINKFENYLNDNLSPEEIFLIINKNILESEYSVYNNELETIYKQLSLCVKVN
jgi:hypothetical protein